MRGYVGMLLRNVLGSYTELISGGNKTRCRSVLIERDGRVCFRSVGVQMLKHEHLTKHIRVLPERLAHWEAKNEGRSEIGGGILWHNFQLVVTALRNSCT
jgi:hypothetical protein